MDVAGEDAVGGHGPVVGGLGVIALAVAGACSGHPLGSSALIEDANVVELYVLDRVAGNAGDNHALLNGGVVNRHVADVHAAELAHWRSLGSAQAPAQSQVDGRVDDVLHRDVGDGDVL